MRKIKLIFVFVFCLLYQIISGQNTKFYNGFGIEIGAGYNTLRTSYKSLQGQNNKNDTIFKRNSLWIQPSLKIYYTIKFRNKNNFEIIPFAGYYCFGGKSKTEPDGYKDIYSFKSIEIGVIPTFILKNKLELSPSIKGQYIISVIGMYYGSLGQSGSLPRKWEKEDYSNSYSKTALSAGIKAKYKIFKKFSIGVETWFGITNMFLNTNNYFKISVTENNYRMFIGYEL